MFPIRALADPWATALLAVGFAALAEAGFSPLAAAALLAGASLAAACAAVACLFLCPPRWDEVGECWERRSGWVEYECLFSTPMTGPVPLPVVLPRALRLAAQSAIALAAVGVLRAAL